jgi:N-acyl-D-aspartate/D-glutamate deacylase
VVAGLILACSPGPGWGPGGRTADEPPLGIGRLLGDGRGAATPGVAAMVIRDGRVVEQGGWGMADLERGIPIGTDTAFRLASVSKQFTAVAILMLAEEGRLAIDDPIVRYLPELSRFGDGIRIRHLLTHTAGLPDYYDVMVAVSGVERPTNRDALAVYAAWGEPLFAPGEREEYSNPGYELLALIVERASGRRFSEFVEGRIFAPLGMTASAVYDERAPAIANRAYGYHRSGDGFERLDDHPLNFLVGSGGIYSTLEDLYRWDRALDSEQLVRRATLEEAFRPTRLAGGEERPYGFGWNLTPHLGQRRVSHGGSWVGFRTFVARYPDAAFSVVVLSNQAETDSEALAGWIAALALGRSTVIANATLLDGTGAPPRPASVRIAGDRIAEVGRIEVSPRDAVVDATGLVLAPGFIDTHSHADDDLASHPDALAAVSQGITSVIVGQDGGSPHPLDVFFAEIEREGAALNVASYAGFGTLRRRVLGEDFRRPATPEEVEQMRGLLRRELAAGALGLATGLEYEPDLYAPTPEVLALAREVAAHGGRYISHIRSEDRRFWQAIDEILEIGREAGIPVQISHVKLALRRDRGSAERLIGVLDAARAAGVEVSADLYPYTYWESTLNVLLPDGDLENRAEADFALSEVTSPEQAWLADYQPRPEYVGLTLGEVAARRGVDPATALIDLIREAEDFRRRTGREDVESVVATSMEEADIERLLRWPHTNLCTDGSLAGSHPRGFGSYPRFLGRYVRERGVVDLASAVHKASGLAAAHMGIRDRGVVAPGAMADLVLFDPDRVLDRATPQQPHALSDGIHRVWVNGEVVYEDGRSTGRRPGRVIR